MLKLQQLYINCESFFQQKETISKHPPKQIFNGLNLPKFFNSEIKLCNRSITKTFFWKLKTLLKKELDQETQYLHIILVLEIVFIKIKSHQNIQPINTFDLDFHLRRICRWHYIFYQVKDCNKLLLSFLLYLDWNQINQNVKLQE